MAIRLHNVKPFRHNPRAGAHSIRPGTLLGALSGRESQLIEEGAVALLGGVQQPIEGDDFDIRLVVWVIPEIAETIAGDRERVQPAALL